MKKQQPKLLFEVKACFIVNKVNKDDLNEII